MKALTKPEKFRAMSRIYGYEDEYGYAAGEELVEVVTEWDPETGEALTIEMECVEAPPGIEGC